MCHPPKPGQSKAAALPALPSLPLDLSHVPHFSDLFFVFLFFFPLSLGTDFSVLVRFLGLEPGHPGTHSSCLLTWGRRLNLPVLSAAMSSENQANEAM